MQLNFDELKRVPIPQILARYGIRLRYRGDWGSCPCPLPTHKAGDKSRAFTVNLKENYFRCFSESCNENNGGKRGGDGINLVACLDKCSQISAAKKIAEWENLNGNKKAEHIARPPREENKPQKAQSDLSSEAVDGKSGYMQLLKPWWDDLVKCGDMEVVRKAVFDKIHESYRNGKTAQN